ncbi:MAG: hypothetical protein R2744_13540 [Bacteroidales bacterium]
MDAPVKCVITRSTATIDTLKIFVCQNAGLIVIVITAGVGVILFQHCRLSRTCISGFESRQNGKVIENIGCDQLVSLPDKQ